MLVTKECRKCGDSKSTDLFSRNKTCVDGLSSWCKLCHGAAVKAFRMTPKGKEATAKWRRERADDHRSYNKTWRNNHRDYARDYAQNRYWANINQSREDNRRRLAMASASMSDGYIRNLIKRECGAIRASPELIKAKRSHLRLVRLIREKQA